MVPDTGIEPARVFPWRPKSYTALPFLWKSKAYQIETGRKIAYLFPAQGKKECQSMEDMGGSLSMSYGTMTMPVWLL